MSSRPHAAPRRARALPPAAAALLLTAWLAAACGGTAAPSPAATAGKPPAAPTASASTAASTAGGGAGGPVEACTTLSSADISAALHVAPSGAGKPQDVGVEHSCGWSLANQALLRLSVFDSAAAQTLTASGSKTDPAWQPVSGLGQKAGYRSFAFGGNTDVAEVEVVLAKSSFSVQVTGGSSQLPTRAALLSLAGKVAAKLS